MTYLENFENGLIPFFNFDTEELKWEKGLSTRIKIKSLPFDKDKKHFFWDMQYESTSIRDFKLLYITCSNQSYLELFVFDKIIYENANHFQDYVEADYFFEFYEQLQIISKKLGITDYYCGEMRNKKGLYKIYNETFQWWDGEIWNNNIDHYRFLCKTANKKHKKT